MSKRNLFILAAATIFAVFLTVGCSVKVTGITLNETQLTLDEGETVQLVATIAPLDATDQTIIWASDNDAVAEVDQEGNVTAKSAGTAIISATTQDGGFKAECQVTVLKRVTGVAIFSGDEEADELDITVGESIELNAVINPELASNQNVEWSVVSGDDKISIEADGLTVTVTGVAVGEAVLKVTTEDGEKTAECAINVITPLESMKITFNMDDVLMYEPSANAILVEKGSTLDLNVVYTPATATYKDVTWSSSVPGKVSVNNGVLTAIDITTDIVTITATSVKHPDVKAELQVVVIVSVTGVEIHHNGAKVETLRININQEVQLTANIMPANATIKEVNWLKVEGSEFIALSQDGLVKGIQEGRAIVRVRTAEGNKTAECEIIVERFVEGVQIHRNGNNITGETLEVGIGQYFDVTAVIAPADATQKGVVWTVEGDTVTLTPDGASCRITGAASGTSVVKVTTIDGSFEATITVFSYVALNSISFSFDPSGVLDYDPENNVITIEKGASLTLVPVYEPANAYYKELNWSSSHLQFVEINGDGVITGVADSGDTEVTIMAFSQKNFSISATIKVKVKVSVTGIDLTVDGFETDNYVTKIGDTVVIEATVSPADASNKDVIWTVVEGEDKVTLQADGNVLNVTANAAGTAKIMGKTADRGLYKEIILEIRETIELEALSIGEGILILERGEEFTLTPVFTPHNTSYKEISWSSSQPDYVSIDQNGKLTALQKTEDGVYVSITATSLNNPSIYTTRLVIVWVSVTEVTMTGQINDDIYEGDTFQLSANVSPADASNADLIWVSSNESIATVDETGFVTILSGGEVTITVKSAENENIFDSWTFTAYDFNNKPAEFATFDAELAQGFVMVGSPINSLVKVTPLNDGTLFYSADATLNTRKDLIDNGIAMAVEAGKTYYIQLDIASEEILCAKFVLVESASEITLSTQVSDVIVVAWTAEDFLVPDTSAGQIATWADLKAALLSGANDITLACNIDAEGEPFSGSAKFTKTFDGQGFYILNFNSTPTANNTGGLFKNVDSPATFKNFTFLNPEINAGFNQTGLLAAYNDETDAKQMLVQNVHVINLIINGGTANQLGVFFGRLKGAGKYDVTFDNCSVDAIVYDGAERVAGLVGYSDYAGNSKITVKNTKIDITFVGGSNNRRGGVIGNVEGGAGNVIVENSEIYVTAINWDYQNLGGVAGQAAGNTNVTVKNSKIVVSMTSSLSGSPRGDNSYIGGVVGQFDGNATIENSYLLLTASGNLNLGRSGGAIGRLLGTSENGITVKNSQIGYNDGANGGARKGGFVGAWEGTRPISVTNSHIYFNRTVTGGSFFGGFMGTRGGENLVTFDYSYITLNVTGTPAQTGGFTGSMGTGSGQEIGAFRNTIILVNHYTGEPLYGHNYTSFEYFIFTTMNWQFTNKVADIDDYIAGCIATEAENPDGYMYWTYDAETNELVFVFPS